MSLVAVDGGVAGWRRDGSTSPELSVPTPLWTMIEGVPSVVGVVPAGVVLPSQNAGMLIDSRPRPLGSSSECDPIASSVWKKTLPSPCVPLWTLPITRVARGSVPAMVILLICVDELSGDGLP